MNHDHLRSAITALNEKLKYYENVEREREAAAEQLKQAEIAREEMRANVRETAERVSEEREKNAKYQEILVGENQGLSKQILAVTEMFSKKAEEFDALKQACAAKEQALAQARIEAADLGDFKAKHDRVSVQNQELTQKCALLGELLEAQAKEHQARLEEAVGARLALAQDNSALRQQLAEAQGELGRLRERLEQAQAGLELRAGEVECERARSANHEGLRELNQRLQAEARQARQERD